MVVWVGLEEDIVSDPSRDLQAAFYGGAGGLVSMQEGKEEGKGWPGRFWFLCSFFLFPFSFLPLLCWVWFGCESWGLGAGGGGGGGIGRGGDRCQLFSFLFFYLLSLHVLDLLVCCQFLGSKYGGRRRGRRRRRDEA